ncbi:MULTISPECIES: hypothetical protein [Paenibacillus]|uniref:hypothetical protein n=1 Tax=Paenibacillus TaxID=44249 RepID=UPI002DC0585D|nr:hypothetical protein [Paenibacillus anseongense]MEC0266358.1 hypothetical protein [Paenibacillus anseongense]
MLDEGIKVKMEAFPEFNKDEIDARGIDFNVTIDHDTDLLQCLFNQSRAKSGSGLL